MICCVFGTTEYHAHKKERFPKVGLEIPVSENEAFLLNDPDTRGAVKKKDMKLPRRFIIKGNLILKNFW